MSVFERTKKVAQKNKISLQSAAEKAGLSKNAIYRWKDVTPSKVSIQAVAKVLHTSYDYLVGNIETDEEKAEENMSRDLKEFLEDNEPMFYGQEEFDEEDIEQIKNFMKGYFISKEGKKNRGEDDNGR